MKHRVVLQAHHETLDARVRRTRDALGDALVALMQEKPFDEIKVQEVLDRAKVSRSTFYKHFSDKDDLFMSDADQFFEQIANVLSRRRDKSDRVFPVREFLAHVAEMRNFFEAIAAAGKLHENLDLARDHFARGIEQRLAELPRARKIPPKQRSFIAFAQAGALVALLMWWADHGMQEPVDELDRVYHQMFWDGLSYGSSGVQK